MLISSNAVRNIAVRIKCFNKKNANVRNLGNVVRKFVV